MVIPVPCLLPKELPQGGNLGRWRIRGAFLPWPLRRELSSYSLGVQLSCHVHHTACWAEQGGPYEAADK